MQAGIGHSPMIGLLYCCYNCSYSVVLQKPSWLCTWISIEVIIDCIYGFYCSAVLICIWKVHNMILLIFHNFHSMFLQSLDLSVVSFVCFFFLIPWNLFIILIEGSSSKICWLIPVLVKVRQQWQFLYMFLQMLQALSHT